MNLNEFISEQHINIFTERILNKFKQKFNILKEKEYFLKNCTNEQFCNFLSSLYFIKFGYLFEYGKILESFMFPNFNILITLDDYNINKIRYNELDIKNFTKIAKKIEKFTVKILRIESLHLDLSSFPPRVPLDQYLANNVEDMAREAATEEIMVGVTKIDELYNIMFKRDNSVLKRFNNLFSSNKIILKNTYKNWLEVNSFE